MSREILGVVEAVQRADSFKHRQLATQWPELAEALAGLIEGMTEHDAPRCWWPAGERPVGLVMSLTAGELVAPDE